MEKEARDLVIFEERVKITQGDWLIFSRYANVSEDEINKIARFLIPRWNESVV